MRLRADGGGENSLGDGARRLCGGGGGENSFGDGARRLRGSDAAADDDEPNVIGRRPRTGGERWALTLFLATG